MKLKTLYLHKKFILFNTSKLFKMKNERKHVKYCLKLILFNKGVTLFNIIQKLYCI